VTVEGACTLGVSAVAFRRAIAVSLRRFVFLSADVIPQQDDLHLSDPSANVRVRPYRTENLVLRRALFTAVSLALLVSACGGERLVRSVQAPGAYRAAHLLDTVLKVHLRDGGLAVLETTSIDRELRVLYGAGTRYDPNRFALRTGRDTIAFTDIALIESNHVTSPGLYAGMATMSAISLGMTAYCIANPKSCFGSCPTFYVWDGEEMSLQAEGFSSSIAPVLRATDLDALHRARSRGRIVDVIMANEALETHVVDHVELRAVPRRPNGRIVATGNGELYEVGAPRRLDRVNAPEGEIGSLVDALDGHERISLASEVDLAEREIIEIETAIGEGEHALVMGFRESLMTTYLFYQGLAYLGTEAGAWIARCERDSAAARATLSSMQRALGGVDVLAQDARGEWQTIGTIDEAGPLAVNVQMLPLPRSGSGMLRLRLHMAKGLWRLDYLALAELGRRVEPIRLAPTEVLREGITDTAALAALLDTSRSLATMRGDRYTLRFELSDDLDYELFLESRGYYLEWMRSEWLAEEDPMKAAQMFLAPAAFLRAEAPRFKAFEPTIEKQFWSSRYAHP
jgi:hypothetical protein